MTGPVPAGRVALVTGASRGIGAELSRRLAGEGFHLTVAARQEAGVAAMAQELAERGTEVLGVAANMAKPDDVERLAREHAARFDRLDLLVLGAGTGSNVAIAELSRKSVDLQIDVNLRCPILLVQHCLPLLRRTAAAAPERGARVVALASITGIAGEPLHSVYGAAKAGLISFCEALSVEEHAHGVSATAVSPGYVDTDMTTHLHDRIDPRGMLRTADVAEIVLAMTRLSPAAVVPNVVLSRSGPQVWRA